MESDNNHSMNYRQGSVQVLRHHSLKEGAGAKLSQNADIIDGTVN